MTVKATTGKRYSPAVIMVTASDGSRIAYQNIPDAGEAPAPAASSRQDHKVGRNDPRPRGSGKKYNGCSLPFFREGLQTGEIALFEGEM